MGSRVDRNEGNEGMIFKREPALIIGMVQAIIALAIAFGFDLSSEQVGAVLALTAAGLAVVTRQSVYSPATVERIEARQLPEA